MVTLPYDQSTFPRTAAPDAANVPFLTVLSRGELIPRGIFPFHSRFRRVINFIVPDSGGGRLVAVVDETIGAGPLNIVVRGRLPEEARSLEVSPGSIRLNGRELDTTRAAVHDGRPDIWTRRQPVDGDQFQRNLATLEATLVAEAAPHSLAFLFCPGRLADFQTGFEKALAARMAEGAGKILRGDLAAGVALLRGCGPGLTPGGDDFLAGFLLGLRLRQSPGWTAPVSGAPGRRRNPDRPPIGESSWPDCRGRDLAAAIGIVYRLARGGNLFSNTALYLAWRGRANDRVLNLWRALVRVDRSGVRAATRNVLATGATSGADFLAGLIMVWKRSVHV